MEKIFTIPRAAETKRSFAQKATSGDLLRVVPGNTAGRVLHTKNLGCHKISCGSQDQWKYLAVDPFDLA